MSDLSVQLLVTSIRSRGKNGGVIFAGRADSGKQFVAVCDWKLVPEPGLIDKGQQWMIRGTQSIHETLRNGYHYKETQIEAIEAELVRPSGRNIISWIAESSDCPGIGQVKATKLYERFGPALVEHIEYKNINELTELLSIESAQLLCHAFDKHKVSNTLLWLDQAGLSRRIGTSIINFYKGDAQAKIEANPYVLISFEANWTAVDDLARTRFNIQEDDPRRMESAIEEALYRGLKSGHTCLPEKDIHARLGKLLGTSQLAKQALSIGADSDQYRQVNGHYQPEGMWLIESYISSRMHDMVEGEDGDGQSSLFSQVTGDLSAVGAIINTYEKSHGIELSLEQRDAVMSSVGAHLSLILGGAGTGKTTVLKVLYQTLESLHPGIAIYQLALAGRAAQRMSEATSRKSMTIAGFLTKIEPGQIEMGSVIVIDEMSMVDVILMYRLLRHIPSGVRLILVGDPAQLPPIGPGLVLHALVGLESIPQVELKVVKRQSAMSGIPQVAVAIRNHQIPKWAEYLRKPDSGVSFIPCIPSRLEETVLQVYNELGGNGSDYNVQILSITKTNLGSVLNLNIAMCNQYQQGAEQVFCHDPEFGVVGAMTLEHLPLKVGDLIIFTENDYDLGLRNGSLGTIILALPVVDADAPCCVCKFEGIEYTLKSSQLQALNHAYSITVHKSQGSQFRRVIIPIRESKLLDQALIYTAITRGVDQVVLIGDENAALRAIQSPASAARRYINLPNLLKSART